MTISNHIKNSRRNKCLFILSQMSQLASVVIHLEKVVMGSKGSRPSCSAEMNNNSISRINKVFDLGVIFLLISGSLYFIYYSLSAGKLIFILLSLLIYLISYGLRRLIAKNNAYSGFTEVGIFFISFLFLAYSITLLNLDSNVRNYLPDKILAGSWSSFIFLIFISVIPLKDKIIFKFVNILIIIFALVLLNIYSGAINNYLQSIPWLSGFIIGSPLFYLLMVLLGLKTNTN
ncbi:MAG: hypothetical protein UX91_C0006G0138 [Candidatus Amesbacteria bacterium GW2011_GWB1_47_19]|nr:MAG: hypothetical protein UW51_C0002G0139 [Candidatus Amesbacteria bacterium GW2011_GWA1_44_24]KKU67076.1 MAG: hypothetical protein UX91_C0006G0138 [Candidatus Amesbacteria bacterium GW2011_GWB1_47_19]